MSVETAAHEVEAAIRDQGPEPAHHRETMRRHEEEWPALWNALRSLLRALDGREPPSSLSHAAARVATQIRFAREETDTIRAEYEQSDGDLDLLQDLRTAEGRLEGLQRALDSIDKETRRRR